MSTPRGFPSPNLSTNARFPAAYNSSAIHVTGLTMNLSGTDVADVVMRAAKLADSLY